MRDDANEERAGEGVAHLPKVAGSDHKHGLFRYKSQGSASGVPAPDSGDFIICRTWNAKTETEGANDVKIAKPYLLRRTPWDTGPAGEFAGQTRLDWEGNEFSYEYISDTERRALRVGGGGGNHEVVDMTYEVDDLVTAIKGTDGGTGVTVNGKDVVWEEENRSARHWFRGRRTGVIWAVSWVAGEGVQNKLWELPTELTGPAIQFDAADSTIFKYMGVGGTWEVVWLGVNQVSSSFDAQIWRVSPDISPSVHRVDVLQLPFSEGSSAVRDVGGDTHILWYLSRISEVIWKFDVEGDGPLNENPIQTRTSPALSTVFGESDGIGGTQDSLWFCSSGPFGADPEHRPRLYELNTDLDEASPIKVIDAPTVGGFGFRVRSIGGGDESVWFYGSGRIYRMLANGLLWSGESSEVDWPFVNMLGVGGE